MSERAATPGFVTWRVCLEPGEERRSDADEWADAFVVVECGPVDVRCASGVSRTFETGSMLALGWLHASRLVNTGSERAELVAVRRVRGEDG